jgi:hypothetical protein
MKDNDSADYLQKPSRRRILSLSGGALATGLAGCLGDTDNGSEPSPTETSTPSQTETSTPSTASVRHEQVDSFTEVRQTETQATTTLSFEVPLGAGQFAHRELRIEEPSELHITGESTAKMDVFLLAGEGSFSKYQAGESAIFSGGFTATDINSIDRAVEVDAGSYFLVFDNSPVYGTDPEGEVNSQFEIVISSGSATPTETETETPTETSTPPGENNAEIVSESDMPKIRKVTDNLGHTFVWDPEESGSDDGYSAIVEEEVVVSDETTIRLTVEEILANPDDDISYSYVFGSSARDHPDNTRFDERIRSNTHTWDMRREDYSSDWRFNVYLRNEDDIYYDNESSQTDFNFYLVYSNLILEE